MNKEDRRLCSAFAGLVFFGYSIWYVISLFGPHGVEGLLMLGVGAVFLVFAALVVSFFVSVFVYGGIWFIQEAFGLHPSPQAPQTMHQSSTRGEEPTDSPPLAQMASGIALALRRAKLEVAAGREIGAICPRCNEKLLRTSTGEGGSQTISCPCGACRLESDSVPV